MSAWFRFVIARLISAALVSWAVLSGVFMMAYWLPSDPAAAAVGPHADVATVMRVREIMCLNKPFWGQYGCFVGRLFRADLGTSFRTGRPVAEILIERIVPTAELTCATFLGIFVIALPLSLLSAQAKSRRLLQATTLAGWAIQGLPPFVVGPVLAILFAHRVHWFPESGAGVGGLDRLRHLVLPTLTLMVFGIATYTRLLGVELRRAREMPHFRVALAKGASEARALVVHALPNAMGPVVAMAGVDLGALLGGAAAVEYVFGWPGLGREALLSVLELDLPVVLGVVLVTAVFVVVSNLMADFMHAVIDPRLRPR